jgi:hypothetical protein
MFGVNASIFSVILCGEMNGRLKGKRKKSFQSKRKERKWSEITYEVETSRQTDTRTHTYM